MIGKVCDCGKRERDIMESKLQFANIPEALRSENAGLARLDAYKLEDSRKTFTNVSKIIRAWIDNYPSMNENGKGLYFFSHAKGSGKTRMAAKVAETLIRDKGISAKFATSMQILDAIKATWDGKAGEEQKLLDDLKRVPVLIIDDFGTEKVRDWMSEKFYSIINDRYLNRKIMIFTSNYRVDELDYDERITNRIKERCYQVSFPEESVRDNIAEQMQKEMTG